MDALTSNLCLTKEDITDDAQKGGDDVPGQISKNIPRGNNPARSFFDACKDSVVTTAACPVGHLALLTVFDIDIQADIDSFTTAGGVIYKRPIPAPATKRKVIDDATTRITTDPTLLKAGCAPFFCVKDNWGFKDIEESFILASFFDEGGRRIECGANVSIRQFLTGMYPPTRSDYSIDLTACGLTTFPNSFLTAHWGNTGDGITTVPVTGLPLTLADNEILFTLQLNGEFVKCVFSYAGSSVTGKYANTSTKRPISKSPSINIPGGVNEDDWIKACFSGNSTKNQWFNRYAAAAAAAAAADRALFIKLGWFILIGKAIGDASFVFSSRNIVAHPQDKRYSVATSDKALGLRCSINGTDVMLVITRGGGAATVRYYLSIQHSAIQGELLLLQQSRTITVSGKKTKVKEKVEKKRKKIYIDTKNTLKKRMDASGLGRSPSGRSYRLQPSFLRQITNAGIQKGGVDVDEVEVEVTWGKKKEKFKFIKRKSTISDFKKNVESKLMLDKTKIKVIIDGKIMKDADVIPADTKKITIVGKNNTATTTTTKDSTEPTVHIINTEGNLENDSRNLEEDSSNLENDSRNLEEDSSNLENDSRNLEEDSSNLENDSRNLEEDYSNPENVFKNFTYIYLRDILDSFTNGVERLSEVKTTLSQLIDKTTDTVVIYNNSIFRIDKNTFNLDVKIICVDIVIKFLKLLVDKIGNDGTRRVLVEKITENIGKKELVFNIYNVIENIPFSVTLIVPKPNTQEDICGIPTTELFSGCVKLLSYLDGIPDFPEDFFKPIYDEIDNLNKNTGTTGKTYTIYTIFSDADSQPITASSIQKRSDQVPYIYLLHSVKTELERYPRPDSTEYNAILNDITRLLSTESSKMEKYKLYNEISQMLIESCVIIDYYELLFMIISSFVDDTALVIRNELFRFISLRGTDIFDIKIIEAFIDGLDVNESMGSIIYNRGFDTIDALINVKEYFDGDLIDTLNDYGFSLKEIGDFMNNLIFKIKEHDLTDKQIDDLISNSLEPIIQQLEQNEQIQQRLDTDPLGLKQEATSFTQHKTLVSPVLGGNNKHRSKHNANYRKKYKKFVNKYIVKKKRNKKKYNTKKSNKNKTRKNKKSKKPKSLRNNKTVKRTKHKSSHKTKFNSNYKSKHNKKVKMNYYNLYKHNKTQKH
jgi:DNA-binding transcriptional MerR regulator